jgi:hypothetical protein
MHWRQLWPYMRKDAWQSGPQNSHMLDRKTLARVIWEYRSLYPRKTVYEAARWLHTIDNVARRYVKPAYALTVMREESAEPSWCWTVLDDRNVIAEFGFAPTEERARKLGESTLAHYIGETR